MVSYGASAETYGKTVFGVATHEFDPDFIAAAERRRLDFVKRIDLD